MNLSAGSTVTESKMLRDSRTNSECEVDLCVESSVDGIPVIATIECRDQRRPADVTWVEQMKAKHERLPPNALILASRSGFTRQAQDLAQISRIKAMAFEEVERTDFHTLLGASNLWHKCVTINTEKVDARVTPTPALHAEIVPVNPDNLVYNAAGQELFQTGALVQTVINAPRRQLGFWPKVSRTTAGLSYGGSYPETHLEAHIFCRKSNRLYSG